MDRFGSGKRLEARAAPLSKLKRKWNSGENLTHKHVIEILLQHYKKKNYGPRQNI